MELSTRQKTTFLELLWDFYAHNARSLPWRDLESDGRMDPYKIMVSELMLQQTQAVRVISKYHEFLRQFPTAHVLAQADLGDVLRAWQGLGYNRRAKFFWQAAQSITAKGYFPDTLEELVKLPGIGINTAGAILAYAFNLPTVFIETNIRTVYLHHFLLNKASVSDREIIALLSQTLDRENTREFYWALMDYGSHLKATVGNPNRISKHYVKQSGFEGSRRQIRGAVIRTLGVGSKTIDELRGVILDDRLESVLHDLMAEGLVHVRSGVYAL
ncbi:MAG TPA: A/G-specific adenine glycosylase [Verrucomicrobiae bacterium]|nr:A/G-specific adenine glycosylase [Verrucomicrobiae bacterium]